jgi:hypothetical protein
VILAVLLAFAAPVYADTPISQPTLKLVSPGKDAKAPLRLVAKKGAKKTMTMNMTMSITTNAGGQSNKIAIPPLGMSVDMKISDVAANGDLTIDMVFGKLVLKADASTPKAMVDGFKKMAEGIAGLKGKIKMSNRGYTIESSIDAPATMAPETAQIIESMRSMMSQISSPVPEEAVGVGAKWETTSVIKDSNGIDLDQVQTSEITAIKGKLTTLKVSVVQSAKPKKIKIKGIDFDLKGVSGGGTGESVYDASTFVPVSGGVDVLSKVTLVNSGNTIESAVQIQMTLKTK